MKKSALVLSFGFLALTGCQENNLPRYETLGGLRILALRSDSGSQFAGPAEFSPGDSVVLTPYVSFFAVSGVVNYTATACPDPGVNVGATPSCDGVAGAVAVASGAVTLTGGGSNTGAAPPFTVSIPSTVLDNRLPIDQYNGVSYLVEYRLTAADGRSVSAVKRLVVSSPAKTAKNQNPVLTAVTANGAALSSLPAGAVEVGVSYPVTSLESYVGMRTDASFETKIEELITTYFITDGSLKSVRTINEKTSTYTPPSPVPVDHSVVLVAVTRDTRGGVSVSVLKLN